MPFVCFKGRILRKFIVLLQLDVVTDALLLLDGGECIDPLLLYRGRGRVQILIQIEAKC